MSLKHKVVSGVVCSVMAVLAIVAEKAPGLKTSDQGLQHIANAEGCRLNAYQCSANRWTVGLGHTSAITAQTQISLEQAADFFIDDVGQAEVAVNQLITQQPSQGEFDMMVSFVVNLGAGNFQRSTLLKKFNAGKKQQACNEYLRWVYVDGKDCRLRKSQCAGIVTRRQIERRVCINGWDSL